MKLKDVPAGAIFAYPGDRLDGRWLKLHENKFLNPRPLAPSLTELAAKLGEGKILHCNPDSEVVLAE